MKQCQTPELIDFSMIAYNFESETFSDGKLGLTKLRQSLLNIMIKKPAKHSRQTALFLLLLIYLQLGPTNKIRDHLVTF